MKKKYILAFTVLLFALLNIVQAQGGLMLYNMQSLPQSNNLNPAFFPDKGFYFSFPSFNIAAELELNPFPYTEKGINGKKVLNVHNFLNNMDEYQTISLTPNVNIFGVGFRGEKWYASFSTSVRTSIAVNFRKEFFELLLLGNGSEKFLGHEATLVSGNFLEGTIWHEAVLGGGYKINDKLSVGANFKYLTGYFNANTGNTKLTLYTDPNIEFLKTELSMDLKMSSLMRIDSINSTGDAEVTSYFPNNHGFGFDVGASYNITDKLQVSASILDFGYITWKENVKHIKSDDEDGTFIYSGMKDFTNLDFSELLDSLTDIIKYREINNAASYTTSLPTKFFVSGSYSIFDPLKVSLLYKGEILNKELYSSINANLSFCYRHILEVSIGNSIINGRWFNPGIGFVLSPGNTFQLYLIVNHMSGIRVAHITSINTQFGINLKFGKNYAKKSKETKPQKEHSLEVETNN